MHQTKYLSLFFNLVKMILSYQVFFDSATPTYELLFLFYSYYLLPQEKVVPKKYTTFGGIQRVRIIIGFGGLVKALSNESGY